jgi:hypothetical protein
VQKVCNKISKCGIKRHRFFVDKVETQLREKNHSGVAKPRMSTIQNTRLVTKQSHSHNLVQWSYLEL